MCTSQSLLSKAHDDPLYLLNHAYNSVRCGAILYGFTRPGFVTAPYATNLGPPRPGAISHRSPPLSGVMGPVMGVHAPSRVVAF